MAWGACDLISTQARARERAVDGDRAQHVLARVGQGPEKRRVHGAVVAFSVEVAEVVTLADVVPHSQKALVPRFD